MRAHGGAAGDGSSDAGQVQRTQLAEAGHGGDDAGCHGHSHGSGTHRDTHQSSHDEGHQHQRQAGVCHGVADDIAQTGVLQHIAQHAAAGSDQQDHTGGLQRLGHDLFQLGVSVAVAGAQQVHSSDGSQQQRHEGLAEEGQNGLDACQCGHYLCHGVCDDEQQRDHDDAHDGAKLGQLALVNVCLLCNVLGDFNHVLFAADAAPDGTGGDHGEDAAEDADEDDPAQINAQHAGHQNGARRGRDEGVADSQTGQQRDDIVQDRALGALCQREGQRDQDDQTGIKEHRHGHHQTCDTQRPCGFFVAELAHHGHGQRLCAAGFFQNGTEHGAKAHQKSDAL